MKNFWRSSFIFLLALTFILAGSIGLQAEEDTVVIGSGAEAPGLDTRVEVDTPAFERINLINEPLIDIDFDLSLKPKLATDWEYNEDNTELTFYLREGVYFHHGREMTAEDVKYTIDWILDPDNDASNRDLYTAIGEVEIIDDYTVTLHLDEVNTFLINNIARFGIVPHDVAEDLGDDFGDEPVGTGPYTFDEWDRDDKLVLQSFDDYWDGEPNFETVEFRPIPENSARLLAFEAGEIDMFHGGVVPEELDRLEDAPNFDLRRVAGTGYNYLGFNNTNEYMQDRNLRLAISHMINREAIVDHVLQGVGRPGQTNITPDMQWYHDELDFVGYNPEKAHEYYEESIAAEEDVELRVFTNEEPFRMQIAEILEYELGELGIDIEVVIEEWGAFLDRVYDTDDYEMYILGWSCLMDPDRASYRQYLSDGSANTINYSNDRMDELLLEGRQVDPESERSIEIYHEVQEILNHDQPKAFINYEEEVSLIQPEFENYQIHPYPGNAWLSLPNMTRN